MSDRLTLAIENAGIERANAERIANAIVDLIRDNMATATELKSDLRAVSADLRRAEITIKADLTTGLADLTLFEHRILVKLGALVLTAVGITLAAIHYLPSAGPG